MNLLEIVIKGGWVMIPIGLCSIIMIAIGVNRYLAIKREKAALGLFLREWERRSPDQSGFRTACKLGPNLTQALMDVWELQRVGRVRMTEIETTSRQELERIETGLGTMATIAAVAPLLGFFGTVTGMVRAFMQIQNLGGSVNASVLAGGIWEALITTVGGLVVGIPALLIYNYLASQTRQTAGLMERCATTAIRQMGNVDEA